MQDKLIRLRKGNLVTQSSMAKLINVDLRTYQNKERGDTQFKQNEMFTIAKFFDKKIDEIFLPTDFMEREVSKRKEK